MNKGENGISILRTDVSIVAAFTLNIGICIFGFLTLLDPPYAGIRMTVCGDQACAKGVDTGSPVYGKVEPEIELLM